MEKKAAKKTPTESAQRKLEVMLNRFLSEGFECNTAYPLHVFHQMDVTSCDSKTFDENLAMTFALLARAAGNAQHLCSLQANCKTPILISAKVNKSVCTGRVWKINATFTFKCV